MSFHVLELHWFHKNFDLIEKLDLKNEIVKVFGLEKAKIFFTTRNHPQIKEILQKHNEIKEPHDPLESYKPDFLKIQRHDILNQIRSALTNIAPFEKILKSSHEVDSFDSLWFLPSIILRNEFIHEIENIIRRNIYEPSMSLYVNYLVFLIRKNSNNDNLRVNISKIYNEFKEKYILIGSSAVSEDNFNSWSNI